MRPTLTTRFIRGGWHKYMYNKVDDAGVPVADTEKPAKWGPRLSESDRRVLARRLDEMNVCLDERE